MGITRKTKEEVVSKLHDKFQAAPAIFLIDYRGLKVEEMNALRRTLGSTESELLVAKNTLATLASSGTGMEKVKELLTGPTAFVFCHEDPTESAKSLVEFQKDHEVLEIKGGVLGEVPVEEKHVKNLATLPSREVLLGMLCATLIAPLRGFLSVLQGTSRQFVGVLEAIRKEKEDGGS